MSLRTRSLPPLPAALTLSGLAAGALGLVVALYVPNAYDKTIPPFVALGALLGAYVYGAEIKASVRGANVDFGRRALARDVVVAVSFALAGIAVFAYAMGSQRTFVVNVALVGLSLASLLGIFAFRSTLGKLSLPLFAAVLHRGLVYDASATQLGLDALFHNGAADAIATTGTLEALSMSKYWYTAGYHLLTATGSSVLDLPIRPAAFVSVTLVLAVAGAIGVFAIVHRRWGATVGALSAFTFLVADRVVYTSVHTTPTTLGVLFFVLLFLFTPAYLATGHKRHAGAFALVLAGVTFTHQFSLFVILLSIGSFALVYAVWARQDGWIRDRLLVVEGLLVSTLVLQSIVTRYDGPAGENSRSFFTAVAPEIVGAITARLQGEERPVDGLPADVVVSGADALSVVQLAGTGLLFCFALVGAIYWLGRRNGEDERTVIAIGATVVVMSTIVFGGGVLGVSVFLPRRWFVFLVVPLAVLAAPGLLALSSKLSPPGSNTAAVCVLLLVLTAPYVVLMFGTAVGAPDDPVFDDAPGAVRVSTTATEAATYEFVDGHAGGSTVVADHLAWHAISRHYGQPAEKYTTEYGETDTVFEGQQLLVYRDYASSDHASHIVRYDDQPYRVYGPLPESPDTDGVVYASGGERIVYEAG